MIEQRGLFDVAKVARDRRDLGMARVTQSARRVEPGFEDEALEAVRRFALKHERFLAEDVRATCATPEGIDGRFWGPVLKRAESKGWIKHDGYAAANSSNRSPKCRWASLICGGGT